MRTLTAATLTLMLASACTMTKPTSELTARCSREIVELHRFFQDWFAGELPHTDEALARFGDVLHPDFHIVGTDGSTLDRTAIIELVRKGYGRTKGSQPPFVIAVKNVQWCSQTSGGLVLTYEEWQGNGDSMSGRTSTVVMQPAAGTPNGLQWMHVHETKLARE